MHDILQTVTWQKSDEQRPMLCGLKHQSYKLERSSDVDEFLDLRVSEAVCNTGTDINLTRNVKGTGSFLDSMESSKRGSERLPYEQVICSVPCRIHSRKPPLNGKSRWQIFRKVHLIVNEWRSTICSAKLWKTTFCPRYVSLLKKHRWIVLFTSDVMYKKYNLVTRLILWARFCKVKLWNKNFFFNFGHPVRQRNATFNYNV